MAYMSKTKRRRVRRQQLVKGLIAIAIIAAVFIIVWQISLGSTYVKVNGVSIRSGMVDGVENFLTYYQTGQFPADKLTGLTGEEKDTAIDMALVGRNSLVQTVFVNNELIKQHFKAIGKTFPTDEQTAEVRESAEALFANTEMARTFRANGVNKSHVEYYYTYIMAMNAYKDELIENNPITEEELQEYYELYMFYFTTPLTLQASHILIMDPEHTPEKRAEIEAILERINEGEDFAALAMQYSEDGSAENGGDLGEFTQGQMVAPFEEAAMALEPGEISGIVETEFGFHIIMLTGKTEEGTQSIVEVEDQLIELISGDRLNDALDVLTESANIEYFGLIYPTSGKPPTNLTELEEIRNPGGTGDTAEEDTHEDEEDHTGHDHD